MDPISIVMIALIGVLIIFMFRNGKKRKEQMEKLQSGLQPGAGVMLQSGIFAVVESVDEENGRVTVRSGDSTLVVHRNAVGQITDPVEAPVEEEPTIAPDDDPAFGDRIADEQGKAESEDAAGTEESDPSASAQEDAPGNGDDNPKA